MLKFTTLMIALSLWSAEGLALTNSIRDESIEWTSVVQIKSEAPDSTGETMPGYCNATFVGKNILVTAAHCVKLAYISKETKLSIETGYYKYVTRPDGQVVRIGYVPKAKFDKHINIEIPKSLADKIARRGEKAQIGPDEDFAILWWEESTPEIDDMTVSNLVTNQEHAEITKNIKNYPLKVVSINMFSVSTLDYKRSGDLNVVKWNNGYIHSKSQSRVEEGDSGAPVFVKINNKLKIFAVVKGRASTVFDNWDVYPSVNPHLCTLNKKMPSTMILSSCL